MTNDVSSSHNAAFLLRMTLGGVLLSHGLLKLSVFTVPGTVAYFAGLGLPPLAAYLTIFGELAGGAALMAGVLVRPAALLSVPLLLGATWAHSGNGWLFSAPGGGWEFPALLVMLALVVALLGGGRFSLGRVMNRILPWPLPSLA